MPGEFGNDSWEENSWAVNGNNGVWTQMAIDEALGLVYLPVETPTGDYFGGHRPGNNLFAESIVAVDFKTGHRKWHFQTVHHPLWGFDIASPPILADITVGGKPIKALAQPGKQSFLYVLDRATGQPVWPIEERAVPDGDVPGEWYAPTQPFPTKPPAYDRQGYSDDYLVDYTPELRAAALKMAVAIQAGADLHAAQPGHERRHARHDLAERRQRWNQLARRRLRSGNARALRAVAERIVLSVGSHSESRIRASRTCGI